MDSGDAFLISYAVLPPIPEVTLFLVGHAVELYLKAVLTKQTRNIDETIKFGHSVGDLLMECQKNEASFMPEINCKKLKTEEEYRSRHHELYTIIENLADLKYIDTTKKKGGFPFAFVFPNSYWIDFFRKIRIYLGWPIKGRRDYLRYHMDSFGLPDHAKNFLEDIYKI